MGRVLKHGLVYDFFNLNHQEHPHHFSFRLGFYGGPNTMAENKMKSRSKPKPAHPHPWFLGLINVCLWNHFLNSFVPHRFAAFTRIAKSKAHSTIRCIHSSKLLLGRDFLDLVVRHVPPRMKESNPKQSNPDGIGSVNARVQRTREIYEPNVMKLAAEEN